MSEPAAHFDQIDPASLLLSDRPALTRARRMAPPGKKRDALLRRFERSQATVLRRADLQLDTALPPELPITLEAERIAAALATHQVLVVCGATGSGKTTQLPKLCLAAGRGVFGAVGHTQPRRLAARAVAERIAAETGTALGEGVGFRVRFADEVGPDSRVIVMTDGILLQELKRDPNLLRYDTLILDEAHERSLNIDFLLGVLRRLLRRRPELRLVVTSATIDPKRFADYFDGAPVIDVAGRSYPIEMRYDQDDGQPLSARILRAVETLLAQSDDGDMLVFLPGERDIRDADRVLRGAGLARQIDVLPLYARLSAARQARVFAPGAKRRVVLSTNVAETSLTVPRIRFVIDSGLARIGRYSHRSKMQRLPIEPVSLASLNQRAGRCGRLGPGVCVRLFDEDDLDTRPEFEAPQIQRSNLAGVILQMAHLGLGRIDDFAFMDPPDDGLVRDGYTLLRELGALDDEDRITAVGRGMAGLPLEPRLARALLAARRFNCLSEALIVVSALAVPDVMERRDAEPAPFVDRRSDWSTRLNLWRALHELGGASRQRAWCREHGVHWVRVLEWKDVHRQLRTACRERRLPVNETPAASSAVHRALLAGFVSHIGERQDARIYRGARGRRFNIFPGSPVAASPPPWIVATELIETSRVFGHQVAAVTPAWIVEAAGHLVRREPVEPAWAAGPGRATARVRAVVFGLSIELRKRMPLAPMDPAGARALAIEHLLVQPPGDGQLANLGVTRHNRTRLAEARHMEQRARRLLVDEGAIFRFFDARVPAEVVDRRSFLDWHRSLDAAARDALKLDWPDLGLDAPLSLNAFPTTFDVGRNPLALQYRFRPGERDDGVTLALPEALIDQLDAARVQWLVPGWLEEKVVRLMRGLPKATRKRLAPIQQSAQRFVDAHPIADGAWPASSLFDALADFVSRSVGERISGAAFRDVELEPYLRARLVILDDQGKTMRDTRDAEGLRAQNPRRARPMAVDQKWHRDGLTGFEPETLPDEVRVQSAGVELVGRPAFVEQGSGVGLRVYADRRRADALHATGVRRLALLHLKDKRRYLRKQLADANTIALLFGTLGQAEALFDDLALCAIDILAPEPTVRVRSAGQFSALVDAARGRIVSVAEDLARDARAVLEARRDVLRRIDARLERAHPTIVADVRDHVDRLVPPTFLRDTPIEWRAHLPRFLKAVHQRLDRLAQRGNESPVSLADVQAREARLAAERDPQKRQRLVTYRWLLEEYRVSLFSQPMRTSRPVSAKRLDAAWEAANSG